MERLPQRLVIIGGGFIALEMAHIFSSFGSQVTLIARGERLLRKEDADVSRAVTEQVARHFNLKLRQDLAAFEAHPDAVTVVCRDAQGVEYTYDADAVLLAQGRVPSSAGLNPSAGGIDVDEDGFVVVDEHLHTSAEGVWALGDVCAPAMLKHLANHHARVVAHNLLHPDDLASVLATPVPHAVFGYPQVASVGMTETQAREAGLADLRIRIQDYADVAYGWAMELQHGEGFCKVIADGDRLVGAHIVGPEAAALLQPLSQAIACQTPVSTLARGQFWVHPALPEVVENALLGLTPAENESAAEA